MSKDIDRRDEILRDLKRADNETESELRPSTYDFIGEYSTDDVLEVFGDWDTAANESGISKKQRLLDDLKRVSEECTGSMSAEDYKEKGNYSPAYIQDVFNSWNDAKKKAGLKVNEAWSTKSIDDYELNKDVKRVNKKVYGKLTAEEYSLLGKYSRGTVERRFDGWSNVRDQLELDPDEGSFEEKMSFEKNRKNREFLEGVLNNLKGLNSDIEVVDYALRLNGSLKGSKKYGGEETLLVCLYMSLRDNGSAVRHKELMKYGNFGTSRDFFSTIRKLKEVGDMEYNPVGAEEFVERYASIMNIEEYEKNLAKEICESTKITNSPSVTASAAIYIANKENKGDLTQKEVADEFKITPVSLRNAKQKIREDVEVKELSRYNPDLAERSSHNSKKSEVHSQEFIREDQPNKELNRHENNTVLEKILSKTENEAERKVMNFFKKEEGTLSFAEVSAKMDLHRTEIKEAISSLTEKNVLEHLDSKDDIIDYYRIKE